MTGPAASVNDPAVAWLIGTILFIIGVGVGATLRAAIPTRRVRAERRWVQPRSDIDRSRR